MEVDEAKNKIDQLLNSLVKNPEKLEVLLKLVKE